MWDANTSLCLKYSGYVDSMYNIPLYFKCILESHVVACSMEMLCTKIQKIFTCIYLQTVSWGFLLNPRSKYSCLFSTFSPPPPPPPPAFLIAVYKACGWLRISNRIRSYNWGETVWSSLYIIANKSTSEIFV